MNDDDLRRLLAEARHDEPMPDDVAARLDDVLAGLADEGPVARPRVVDLDTQRRRRRVRSLLVAAVAVVLVGVGIGQLDLTRSAGDADGGSSQIAADSGGSTVEDYSDESAASAPSPQLYDRVEVGGRPLKVDDDDFDEVAREKAVDRRLTALDQDVTSEADGNLARASWFQCKRAPFGRGRLVAVEYAGNAAVLAVRPRTGDTVVVELLQCGTATVLRSATVPVP